MNATVLRFPVWPIIVLIVIAGCINKAEASHLQVDMRSNGKSRAVADIKTGASKNTKWGYCYEPDVKIIKMKDNEYHSYDCQVESGWTGYFEIYRNDRKIYSERIKNGKFSVYDLNDLPPEDSQKRPPEKDINGDGIPEMVMERHIGTGQFTDRYSYPIYSIGKSVRKVVTIEGMYSPMKFIDLDGDDLYEITGEDWVLAYFFGDFLSSPHPTIILKWQKGGYRLGFKLMKKLSPTKEELKKKAEDLRKSLEESIGPFPEGYILNIPHYVHTEAWSYLVDLIYAGNAKAAWKFLDMYWIIPPGCTNFKEKQKEKRWFIAAFKKQLTRSPYWKDLKILNSWH